MKNEDIMKSTVNKNEDFYYDNNFLSFDYSELDYLLKNKDRIDRGNINEKDLLLMYDALYSVVDYQYESCLQSIRGILYDSLLIFTEYKNLDIMNIYSILYDIQYHSMNIYGLKDIYNTFVDDEDIKEIYEIVTRLFEFKMNEDTLIEDLKLLDTINPETFSSMGDIIRFILNNLKKVGLKRSSSLYKIIKHF